MREGKLQAVSSCPLSACDASAHGDRFAAVGLLDYIQLYHGNASLLAESLEVIQQIASVILGALDPAAEQDEGAEQAIDEKPELAEVA